MEQNYHTGMRVREDLFYRLFRIRLLVIVPVRIGVAPEYCFIAELGSPVEILLGKASLGRTVAACKLVSGKGGILLLKSAKLPRTPLGLPLSYRDGGRYDCIQHDRRRADAVQARDFDV